MARLTKRTETGSAYLAGVKPNEQAVDCKSRNTLQCILDCFERCAAYEDATHTEDGTEILTVEEIAELAKAKKEGRDYKALFAKAVELLETALIDLDTEDVCQVCAENPRATCCLDCDECTPKCYCRGCTQANGFKWQHAGRLEKLREAVK